MLKLVISVMFLIGSSVALAIETPITGNVQSKCMVTTDKNGVYGTPSVNVLSTDPVDGGVLPIVRYDVSLADAYTAVIKHPNSFSQSPSLDDVVSWTGSTSVEAVSDAAMSAYDTNKVEYENVTEIDLSVTGSTWFKISSEATYGFSKAFPGGTYTAVVEAECIAQ